MEAVLFLTSSSIAQSGGAAVCLSLPHGGSALTSKRTPTTTARQQPLFGHMFASGCVDGGLEVHHLGGFVGAFATSTTDELTGL